MTIKAGMRQIKTLGEEIVATLQLLQKHSADFENESPVYKDQPEQVKRWEQSVKDKVAEIENLTMRVYLTNISTYAEIEVVKGKKKITKRISEWVLRRQKLCAYVEGIYVAMSDRGLRDKEIKNSSGGVENIKVRRYYDSAERDEKLMTAKAEAGRIDSGLEDYNATVKLLVLPTENAS